MIAALIFAAVFAAWLALALLIRWNGRFIFAPVVNVITDRFCPPGTVFLCDMKILTRSETKYRRRTVVIKNII